MVRSNDEDYGVIASQEKYGDAMSNTSRDHPLAAEYAAAAGHNAGAGAAAELAKNTVSTPQPARLAAVHSSSSPPQPKDDGLSWGWKLLIVVLVALLVAWLAAGRPSFNAMRFRAKRLVGAA